jgi:hypothetical protein
VTDIVPRLRAVLNHDRAVELTSREAADEIERLRAELVRTQKIACDNFARRATVNASKRARWFAEQMKWECFKEESR